MRWQLWPNGAQVFLYRPTVVFNHPRFFRSGRLRSRCGHDRRLIIYAQIGWSAWFRTIDLVTPQPLKGEELLRRARGWWTVEPTDIAGVVKEHGRLVVGDGGELMVEFEDEKSAEALSEALKLSFGDQVQLAP